MSEAQNINLRSAMLHVLGDLVQSSGVALAGLLIWWHEVRGGRTADLVAWVGGAG